MKKINGKITISRRFSGDEDYMSISLKDDTSSVAICNVEMGLVEFARALTGLGYVDCDIDLYDTYEKAGKKLIVKRVACEKDKSYSKDEQKRIVQEDFLEKYSNKWEIHSDGTGTKQPGERHVYCIRKYIDFIPKNKLEKDMGKL